MTLAEWLRSTGTTQLKLAEMTGIPQPELSKYTLGKRGPGLKNAVVIERATEGAVPVESWLEVLPANPALEPTEPTPIPPAADKTEAA